MKIAGIVTSGRPAALLNLLRRAIACAEEGSEVRIFFRDEAIPALCVDVVAERLGWPELSGGAGPTATALVEALGNIPSTDDLRLYICTSSMYVWGVSAADLRPGVSARGLVAFLAEDLDGADDVWCV